MWAEYFGGIGRLAAHPSFPLASFPAILQHELDLDLANIAVTWGDRLKGGWQDMAAIKDVQDMAAIKDVQRDVCTDRVHAMQARPQPYHVFDSTHPHPQQTVPSSTSTSTPINSREDYNKETDVKPCYPWNWGKDWGFSASHGASAELYLHICT